MVYSNREDAGTRLAVRLKDFFEGSVDGLVMAITRGGVVVGDAIARELNLPLDVFVVKRINFPGAPEYSLGAVDRDGHYLINPSTANFVDRFTFEAERLKNIRAADQERSYLSENSPIPQLEGKTIILVDDGAQSGNTSLMAVEMLKNRNPGRIVLALPICSREALQTLEGSVDALIVDIVPAVLHSLSDWYFDFLPEEDDKVRTILENYLVPPLTTKPVR